MCEVEEHYQCRSTFFECRCKLKGEHDIHVCTCGGSWDDKGDIVEYPQRLVDGILNNEIKAVGEYSHD